MKEKKKPSSLSVMTKRCKNLRDEVERWTNLYYESNKERNDLRCTIANLLPKHSYLLTYKANGKSGSINDQTYTELLKGYTISLAISEFKNH